MATIFGGAEGLMTYEEVRRRPDWPKRDEAIKRARKSKEIKYLAVSGS